MALWKPCGSPVALEQLLWEWVLHRALAREFLDAAQAHAGARTRDPPKDYEIMRLKDLGARSNSGRLRVSVTRTSLQRLVGDRCAAGSTNRIRGRMTNTLATACHGHTTGHTHTVN